MRHWTICDKRAKMNQ